MGLFGRGNQYDRKILLREARDAQSKRKHKKAVDLLRRISSVEPNNCEIHAMMAPSLAERGLEFCAWEAYVIATSALLREGKKEAALGFYRDATERMPRHYEAWISRSDLERSMGRRDDALGTLADALPHFRRRASRYQLISLLRGILKMAPGDKDAVIELAFALSKTGQRREAIAQLEKLAKSSDGRYLRHVRRIQWNITPNLVHSWLWLRACAPVH